MLIALLSSTTRAAMIGVANGSAIVMYAANVMGMFSNLALPAAMSFIIQVIFTNKKGYYPHLIKQL